MNTMRLETLESALADFYSTVEAFDIWAETEYERYIRENHVTITPEEEYILQQIEAEKGTREWLRKHSGNPADDNYSEIYSDIYKDLYGVRPRW